MSEEEIAQMIAGGVFERRRGGGDGIYGPVSDLELGQILDSISLTSPCPDYDRMLDLVLEIVNPDEDGDDGANVSEASPASDQTPLWVLDRLHTRQRHDGDACYPYRGAKEKAPPVPVTLLPTCPTCGDHVRPGFPHRHPGD